MISIIMPFWKRQEQANRTLETYARFYQGWKFEVIVIDDGSPEPFKSDFDFVKVIRFPEKDTALNPCVPFNEGVRQAKGDVLVLTNPECTPRTPFLRPMFQQLEVLGPQGYVAACCWSVDTNRWYVHPSVNRYGKVPLPEDGHFHMCAMLYRNFYEAIGGFDESYRLGAGYDDNDLLKTLEKHKARFYLGMDWIVDHHQARSLWPSGAHERNEEIFLNKWKSSASDKVINTERNTSPS